MTELELRNIGVAANQVTIDWSVGNYGFSTDVWYETVDFGELRTSTGSDWLDRTLFGIALFEIDKGVSLHPDRLVLDSPWDDQLTPELAELWSDIVRGVFAQWRYENDQPSYSGPSLPALAPPGGSGGPVSRQPVPLDEVAVTRPLVFCGGGKDSLVAMTVLDQLGVAYDSVVYSHSVYGPAEPQHELIDGLLDHCNAGRRHRFDVFDSMLALPVRQLRGGFQPLRLIAGETPASVFEAMPIARAHGYSDLVVAHERSANSGNLLWAATGEEVNHQWGKSRAAEVVLADYLAEHLAESQPVRYWSILQEVHDPVIFSILRERADAVADTHSCNVAKPWCMRCAKCAYVWLGYKAWLPWEVVDPMFGGRNLLDVPEDQLWYRQLLGLEAHTPFECIGGVDEVRLSFAMCRAKGLRGAAMAMFDTEVAEADWIEQAADSLRVHPEDSRAPGDLAPRLTALLEGAATEARRYAEAVLA